MNNIRKKVVGICDQQAITGPVSDLIPIVHDLYLATLRVRQSSKGRNSQILAIHTMDPPIVHNLDSSLRTNAVYLHPSISDAHKETIWVAACIGGGMLIMIAVAAGILLVRRRARWRNISERDAATGTWTEEA